MAGIGRFPRLQSYSELPFLKFPRKTQVAMARASLFSGYDRSYCTWKLYASHKIG